MTDMTDAFQERMVGGGSIRNPVSFGEDHAGNLYIVKFGDGFFPPLGTGEIYQIVAVPEPAGAALAAAAGAGLLLRRKRAWHSSRGSDLDGAASLDQGVQPLEISPAPRGFWSRIAAAAVM